MELNTFVLEVGTHCSDNEVSRTGIIPQRHNVLFAKLYQSVSLRKRMRYTIFDVCNSFIRSFVAS
jgi:hypothetical protein